MADYSRVTREDLEKYFSWLKDDYREKCRANSARNEEMYRRAYNAIGVSGAAQAAQMRSSQAEPEQKCPAYRMIAEPCGEGFRMKRYEQVAGTAELVLVSVEIVRT